MTSDKKGYQTPGFLKTTSNDSANIIKLVSAQPASEDSVQYYIPTHGWREADGNFMSEDNKNALVKMIRDRLELDGVTSVISRDGDLKIEIKSVLTDDFIAALRKEDVIQEIAPWLQRTGNKTTVGSGPGF
jgi:hypothetical protein